ncbi:hypothetical protein BOTBODRAFT_26564 [Botryobasidium botryosum FD-172 SS1]|uniref:Transcriptional regulatory protein RXT2 N-terminal domain-containing protein n=1 Tax=Botryobasidium botryosum (strain FD-172 SS1) TaxID=930990 RepID=A0A067MY63_BOTB1|nr:hypothetical protein BOTBODRAFT_26564 [Botryobasidium botryosum FD-172 SS1]
MEERARKRLKRVLPQSPPSSPPMPTLTHLRPVTPPLTASYVPMASQHPNFSSFVLDPSVQHAFTSSNVVELGATATELIEGEGALRRALGALWKALDVDSFRAPAEERNSSRRHTPNYMGNGDNDEDEDDDSSSFRQHMRNGMSEEELPPLQRLFITTQPIMLPGGEPRPLLPQNQVESLEWSLGVLRELADDGREYTDRLEEIREGLAQARAVRKVVWTACREAALDEMEVAPVLD